jgi:hypothetical protein
MDIPENIVRRTTARSLRTRAHLFRWLIHTALDADHTGFSVSSLDQAVRLWVEGLGAELVRTGEMGGDFLANVTVVLVTTFGF